MTTDPIERVQLAELAKAQAESTAWLDVVARADDGKEFDPSEVFALGKSARDFKRAIELRVRRREAADKLAGIRTAAELLDELNAENEANTIAWREAGADHREQALADYKAKTEELNERVAAANAIIDEAVGAELYLMESDETGRSDRLGALRVTLSDLRTRIKSWSTAVPDPELDRLKAQAEELASQVQQLSAELRLP